MSELIQKQHRYFNNLALLLTYACCVVGPKHSMKFRLGEGYVGDSIDKHHEDTPHLRRGTHFLRLGLDLVMDHVAFGVSTNVTGHHEAWDELGAYWKGLDPENRWGGDFKDSQGRPRGDYGHFSKAHGGVA